MIDEIAIAAATRDWYDMVGGDWWCPEGVGVDVVVGTNIGDVGNASIQSNHSIHFHFPIIIYF